MKDMAAPTQASGIAARLGEHEGFLHGLCYRLMGSAADAEDLVQETFVRALERPPAQMDAPLRPWLVTVAMNLGRDALRRRKRRGYVGPWLPSPIETESEPPSVEIAGEQGTEGRYDRMESVSFAFLLALEALTPQQRAVLLLRDVFDYSVQETADALGLSLPNVKTTHHRARKALEPYEQQRCRPSPALVARSGEALQRFLQGLLDGDLPALEALLSKDVLALSDGGGEYLAAKVKVTGASRVAKLYLGLQQKHGAPDLRYAIRLLNGLPALVAERPSPRPGESPRFVLRVDVDVSGKITAVHSVLASRKLTAVQAIRGG